VLLFATELLQVTVTRRPWALSFGPLRSASPVGFELEQRRDTGPALLGDADPDLGRWHRALSVREDEARPDRYRAVLETDDPTGRTLEVDVSLVDRGTVAVRAEAGGVAVMGQGFAADADERFLGFGERSHAYCIERGVVENYVGEGPFQPHEYDLLTDTVPPWGVRRRADATYFPVPWVLSTRGYGVLVDQDDLSYVRLRTADDQWSIEVEADRLAYRVFAGPSPLEALARFSAATGRQPQPEPWFFGPWYQTGHANHVPLEEERRQLDLMDDVPLAAAETHCRYLPMGEDRGHEEAEQARTAFFHGRGLCALSYINPLVSTDYPDAFDRAAEAGALQGTPSGDPYVFRAYVGGRVPPHTLEAQYDFTHPAGGKSWADVAGRIVAAGYDGWMEDFGEYTPLDAAQHDGSVAVAAHNRYPTEYHGAAAAVAGELERRAQRKLARFVRSGWTGTAAVAPIVWGGDPTTSWGFDGLESAVVEGLSMGASGVAMWGSDTGGFFSTEDRLTPELLRRWIQFSAFCPVMRTKAGGIAVPDYVRPQVWDEDILPCWRRWARWHTRLNDYLAAAHQRYRATGRPIMCPLELAHPELRAVRHEYLLGEDLLVAPVLEPGCELRRLTVPEGEWVDLFDRSRSLGGPATAEVPVGPDAIPVFVRAGAVLALLPDDVLRLGPYGPGVEDRREVRVYPATEWSGPLGSDQTGRSEVEDGWPQTGWWTLELRAPRVFGWRVRATLPRPPSAVRADGPWSFADGLFACTLTGTSGSLRVTLGP
jgi:sulfoquinovosidase